MSPREITLAIDALNESGKLAEVKTFLQQPLATAPKAALQYHLPLVVAAEIQRRMVAEGNIARPASVAAPAPHPIPPPAQVDAIDQQRITHTAGQKARAKQALNMEPTGPMKAEIKPPAKPVESAFRAVMLGQPGCLEPLTDGQLDALVLDVQAERVRRRRAAKVKPMIDQKKAALLAKIKAMQQQVKALETGVLPTPLVPCPDCDKRFVNLAAVTLHRVRAHGWRKAKAA